MEIVRSKGGGAPSDLRVRQGIASCTDRAALIRSLMASRSIFAAQAMTASTTSAAGPLRC